MIDCFTQFCCQLDLVSDETVDWTSDDISRSQVPDGGDPNA